MAEADAIGQGVLVALGCNSDTYIMDGRHVGRLKRPFDHGHPQAD
jgi:hypothetical protein